MMELRERVALDLLNSERAMAGFPPVETRDNIPDSGGYLVNADAAIAAVLDALQEPSEGMRGAWASSGKHDDWRKECDIGWQAMLSAFRSEALGEG